MHSFVELIDHGTAFTLDALNRVQGTTVDALESSGATPLVKALQVVQLQKVTLAVGMFSIFDAVLQDALGTADGFAEAERLLVSNEEHLLHHEFRLYRLAINVLKHGRGSSYTKLLAEPDLQFNLKQPDQSFFLEGDVSEVDTLIEVTDSFVQRCAELIRDVAAVIKALRPEAYL
jgi:hypothetical protein